MNSFEIKRQAIAKALSGKRFFLDEITLACISRYFDTSIYGAIWGSSIDSAEDGSVEISGQSIYMANKESALISSLEVLSIVRGITRRFDMLHREKRNG